MKEHWRQPCTERLPNILDGVTQLRQKPNSLMHSRSSEKAVHLQGGLHLRALPAATQKATHLARRGCFPIRQIDFHDTLGRRASTRRCTPPVLMRSSDA